MDNIEPLMTRLKYALKSLGDEDQLKMVEIVEMFATQINQKNLEASNESNYGGENEK